MLFSIHAIIGPGNDLFDTEPLHDDVIKWKHFPRYWPFVGGIQRSPLNSPHKGQWRGPLMFPLICTWMNGWVNNRETGDLRRHRSHYDVIIMNYRTHLWLCSTTHEASRTRNDEGGKKDEKVGIMRHHGFQLRSCLNKPDILPDLFLSN